MPTPNNNPRTSVQQRKSSKLLKIDRNQIALQDAFDPAFRLADSEIVQAEIDNERCARAVSFLLAYSSDFGNEPLAGDAAVGLSSILDNCARGIAFTATQRNRPTKEAARG
jgi:hypothetical protein